MTRKKPKIKHEPDSTKIPQSVSVENPFDLNPVWQISRIDLEGPWSWINIDKDCFFNTIVPRIKSLETMLWKNLFLGNLAHVIPISKIDREAQKRLEILKINDVMCPNPPISPRFFGEKSE